MNVAELKKIVEKLNSKETKDTDVSAYIGELKAIASGVETHYKGEIDFRYKNSEEIPDPGFVGNPGGYTVNMDIRKRHQFQSEYMSVGQMFGSLGYSSLKTNETIDPSAISNLMNIYLDKKKTLEDRTMQLLGSINTVLKSIIALTYELKELDKNLQFYDLSKSKEKEKAEAAELALKRIFLDNVDARKGGASLSSLSRSASQAQGGGPGFIDIVAVFYTVKSLKDVANLQRNEQYKNILKNRYIEYEGWKDINGKDLKNRKMMLLQYLKSQMSSFNMYVEWTSQYMSILKRIGLKGPMQGKDLLKAPSQDIFETSVFTINLTGFKKIYIKEFDVEYKKLFGEKGPELPSKVALKSTAGKLLTRGYKEQGRSYLYKRIKNYGPVVVSAIEASFSFREKQAFLSELPQPPSPQYEGALRVNLTPMCFTPEEWYLYQKALIAYANKTVFSGVDQAIYHSLDVIKKDLDAYIKEADEYEAGKLKEKSKKPQSALAFDEIYRSFKDDFFGISKSIVKLGEPIKRGGKKEEKDFADYYEMIVNKRLHRGNIKNGIEVGLFVANSEAEGMYNEFKRRLKLLNNLSQFTIY